MRVGPSKRGGGRIAAMAMAAVLVAIGPAACGSGEGGPVEGGRTIDVAGLPTHAVVRNPTRAPAGTVVFLHGAAYDSKIWARRGILDDVVQAGWRAVAVDLPGHGETEQGPGVDASEHDRALFVSDLIERYGGPEEVVLVSPSMSGLYSIPYLNANPKLHLRGFVPVAPSITETLRDRAGAPEIPTLSVFGSEDPQLDTKRKDIEDALPGTETKVITDASHAAYDDHPEEFSGLLVSFLLRLSS